MWKMKNKIWYKKKKKSENYIKKKNKKKILFFFKKLKKKKKNFFVFLWYYFRQANKDSRTHKVKVKGGDFLVKHTKSGGLRSWGIVTMLSPPYHSPMLSNKWRCEMFSATLIITLSQSDIKLSTSSMAVKPLLFRSSVSFCLSLV
mgnify:CR=1 FL=1